MLKDQLAKGNNGLKIKVYRLWYKSRYLRTGKAVLERIEIDVLSNLKYGCKSRNTYWT